MNLVSLIIWLLILGLVFYLIELVAKSDSATATNQGSDPGDPGVDSGADPVADAGRG